MNAIINQSNLNIKSFNHSPNRVITLNDTLARMYDGIIGQNIEAFHRSFSEQEVDFFKYLCYYHRKFEGNIQIPIKNLMERFNLSARRIHYLLSKIAKYGLINSIKKGHTRRYTKRALTARGVIFWEAISKGFAAVKQLINRTCADSCADSPPPTTIPISTKVDKSPNEAFFDRQKRDQDLEKQIAGYTPDQKKGFIEKVRDAMKKKPTLET
jgi:DNA-binding MarR family transcriptional regulator